MALWELKEFASRCGVKPAYIQQYYKRGKITQRPDGLFDDQDEKNSLFMATRKKADLFDSQKPNNILTVQAEESKPNPPKIENPLVEMEKKKKQLEIDKLEQDLRLNRIRELKLTGEVVPTDQIQSLFTQHTKSIINRFHQAGDNLITEIAKKKALSPDEVADLRFDLVNIINKSTMDAIQDSLKQVDFIQQEYSQKRERGERK